MNSQSTKGQEEKQADIICSDHLTKRESGNCISFIHVKCLVLEEGLQEEDIMELVP